MAVPCGKCVECCTAYANEWASRCMDEASLYDQNCYITLTYEKTDGHLYKRHLQKFFKRLRKRIYPQKLRYYACGEYGGRGNRPHYHAIIFGWFPPDAKYITTLNGNDYYRSDIVFDTWRSDNEFQDIFEDDAICKGGFISVSNVTYRSAKYCCKYLQKIDDREHLVKPFTLCSRKPAIGAGVVSEQLLLDGVMYRRGKPMRIPKIYLDILEKRGYNVDIVKEKRRYIMQQKEPLDYRERKKNFERGQRVNDRMHRMKGG